VNKSTKKNYTYLQGITEER